jgi:ABC-type branched-subunit amino acid transport system permease subunit
MLSFGLGCALAAAAGVILTPVFPVTPAAGVPVALTAFVVVVLGGMGSMWGCVVGGLLLGLVENLGAAFISTGYKNVFGFIILILVILYWMIHSNLGQNFRSVQNDELAARSVGVKVLQVRMLAFTVASARAGFAGGLYGHYLLLITPEIPSLDLQFYVLAMTVIGGMGSFIGPIVGAFALNILAEKIRDYGEYHVLVFGLVALVVARFAPNGLLGVWRKFRSSTARPLA